jgi:hypothetical protein
MTEERIVHTDGGDAASTAIGASTLIRTIVWAIVVLVLLGVGLYALHVYTHIF